MIYLLIILVFYIILKLVLYYFTNKYGKFSFDNFSAFGFNYDSKKDIFYSTKKAWQKNFGYSHLYDIGAPLFGMIIDTEPIRFFYNDKNWLLTFWKGQYGITTGAEIGIYQTKEKIISKNTLYLPVNDDEMLDMSFTLIKNDKVLTNIKSRHWWLAAFKLGNFSKPKELKLDIKITFSNSDMLNAFLKSFKKLGYKECDYEVNNNTFCFLFIKPKSRKVWTRNIVITKVVEYINKRNVKLYNKYFSDILAKNESNNVKKIILNDLIPDILKNNPTNEKLEIANRIITNNIYLDKNVYSGYNHEIK